LNNEQDLAENLDQDLDISNRYTRIQYRKKWDKLTVSPGVSLNNYSMSTDDGETTIKSQYFLPQLNTKYEFGSSHDLEVSYQQSIEYNDVSSYAEGYILDRYNTLLFGNIALNPAVYHSINARYRNYNMYNFFNIHGGFNYQYIKDGFTTNQQLNNVENVLSSINSNAANQITTAYVNLEKRFDHFRISGTVNVSHTVLNNEIESQLIQNDNFTQQYLLNTSAKLGQKLTLRTGYSVSINTYTAGEIESRFENHSPEVSSTFSVNGWRIDAEYSYNNYVNKNQNQKTSFDMLDAAVSYRKKKSPWEFKVQGFNLIDTRSVRRDSFSNNLISTFSYNIQQRYGLLTVKYDL
jgi:hypothetical protein